MRARRHARVDGQGRDRRRRPAGSGQTWREARGAAGANVDRAGKADRQRAVGGGALPFRRVGERRVRAVWRTRGVLAEGSFADRATRRGDAGGRRCKRPRPGGRSGGGIEGKHPLHPGSAGRGQDLHRLARHRGAAEARQARWRVVEQPQGDQQSAREGRGGGKGRAGQLPRRQEGQRERRHIASTARSSRTSSRTRTWRPAISSSSPERRGSSRAPSSTRRSTTSSSTRRARWPSPT